MLGLRQPLTVTPLPVLSDAVTPVRRPVVAHDKACDVMLIRLSRLPVGHPDRGPVRAKVIETSMPLALSLARRFHGRAVPVEDLNQVAVVGLIKAVDGYDTTRGVTFSAYAVPTILGEVKRHFRDATWMVHVPRRLQDLALALTAATEDLVAVLHRWPTVVELAAQVGANQREVLSARHTVTAYRPLSIEHRLGIGPLRLADALGGPDPELGTVDDREALRPLLDGLATRERRIITLRFYGGLSQRQIAAELGISQMHVSRLLARTLSDLRDRLIAAHGHAATTAEPPLPHGRVPAESPNGYRPAHSR